MKKKLSILLSIMFILSMLQVCSGQILILEYDGVVHNVEQESVDLYINKEKVETEVKPVILEGRTLVPLRGIFEKLGAKVDWDNSEKVAIVKYKNTTVKLKINDKKINVNGIDKDTDVPAKLINNSTMVPIRVISENLNLKVQYNNDARTVSVDEIIETVQTQETPTQQNNVKSTSGKPEIYSIDVSMDEKQENALVKINCTDKIESYDKFHLDTSFGDFERIVVDINDTVMKVANVDYASAEKIINNMRYSQRESDDKYVSRIVLELKNKMDYSVVLSDDEKSIYIVFGEGQGIPEQTIKVISVEELNRVLGDNDISVNKTASTTNIVIKKTSDEQKYEVKYNSKENQIIVEIDSANFSKAKHEVYINDKIVKSIATSMKEATGKVVIQLLENAKYSESEVSGKIVINIEKQTYSPIISYAQVNGVGKITIDNEDLAKKILFTEDLNNKKMIAQIPLSAVVLNSTNIEINDDILRSIYVEKKDNYYEIQINYVNKVYCISDEGPNDTTVITVMVQGKLISPLKKNVKVVVDPGHGGTEVGAKWETLYEKDLTLDISLRVEKLLKQNGINVTMTRDDDSTVGLKDRANIANEANADLFISIHINSYDDIEVLGTETLYYSNTDDSSGISGMRFAEVVQAEMAAALGTKNRGIKSRPKLVVLNSTEMPAVLAEVAFMSNESDRENLLKPEFKQKAAEALYNGIVKAINEM